VREYFEIIALQTRGSLIPTLLPEGEGLCQIIPDSSGRRPESSVCSNMPLVFVLAAQVSLNDWIPAFAGMTGKEI
jgi:hypothetical protein